MYINLPTPYWFTEEGILKIQDRYNAKYLGAWCIKDPDGNWTEFPVDTFYAYNPDLDKGHSHYFGMYIKDRDVYICNAASAFDLPITGIIDEEGNIRVSRYRHHSNQSNEVGIDGGRDYTRISGNPRMVTISVDKDEFVINEVAYDYQDGYQVQAQEESQEEGRDSSQAQG